MEKLDLNGAYPWYFSTIVNKGKRDTYKTKKYFKVMQNLKCSFIWRYSCQYIPNIQYSIKYTHTSPLSNFKNILFKQSLL